jgi:hypothetical protein
MASAALEWPKKTAARAYGSLARLRRRSILIYQKTHLIVAPIQSRTRRLKLAAQTTDILPRQKPSDSKQMQIRRLNLIQNTESTTIKATTRAGEPAQREQSDGL